MKLEYCLCCGDKLPHPNADCSCSRPKPVQPGDHINGQNVLAVVKGQVPDTRPVVNALYHWRGVHTGEILELPEGFMPVTAIIVERQEKLDSPLISDDGKLEDKLTGDPKVVVSEDPEKT